MYIYIYNSANVTQQGWRVAVLRVMVMYVTVTIYTKYSSESPHNMVVIYRYMLPSGVCNRSITNRPESARMIYALSPNPRAADLRGLDSPRGAVMLD